MHPVAYQTSNLSRAGAVCLHATEALIALHASINTVKATAERNNDRFKSIEVLKPTYY
jgi:hypothetical protein